MLRALAVVAVLLGACSSGSPPCYCPSYVDCFYKTGGTGESVNAMYGPAGSCWVGGSATAEPCCRQCNAENDKFKTSPKAIDAGCTFDRVLPSG